MKAILKNPIALTYLAIAAPLFLFALFTGFGKEALQLLVVPYTYDYSRGVGKVVDEWISGGLLGLQIVIVAMAWSVPSVSGLVLRRLLWSFGIVLVLIYLLVMMLAYASTGIH